MAAAKKDILNSIKLIVSMACHQFSSCTLSKQNSEQYEMRIVRNTADKTTSEFSGENVFQSLLYSKALLSAGDFSEMWSKQCTVYSTSQMSHTGLAPREQVHSKKDLHIKSKYVFLFLELFL